ncbi:amidase [Alsobacter sp. KACC 23698]|uniref:Amidase n=1 Tax=Alsobacter sp. KACC 23698 TaxID=3149229 RepID=A0AAU7JEG4_9HYPH
MSSRSAAATVEMVRRRSASAVEMAEQAIRRITDRADLNAVVDFDPEEGLRRAQAVDRRLADGEALPLAGLPVVVKDNIWVAGRRVTQGSLLFRDFVPDRSAVVVERLERAGAVIVGMGNTPEFACKGQTTNRVYGATRHPADPALTPGGSSGGSAVAVAAGLVPAAIGTDGGGSGRRPPAHVGVVGFKPSFGALPYGPGFPEPFTGIATIAPIARTVTDTELLFEALVGPDLRDPDSAPLAGDRAGDARALRIGVSPRFGFNAPVDDVVAAAFAAVVDALDGAGYRLIDQDPAWPAAATEEALMPLQHAGLAAIHGAAFRATPDLFDPDVAAQIERGFAYDGPAVARARWLSHDIARAAAACFGDVDFLIGPTVPCAAWAIERLGPETIGGAPVAPRAHAVFTPFFNHALTPAISIPMGRTPAGLPLGLQIVGARGQDRRVLQVAAAFERILADAGLWAGLPVEEHGRA